VDRESTEIASENESLAHPESQRENIRLSRGLSLAVYLKARRAAMTSEAVLREFEEYKQKNPEFFPDDQPLEKQLEYYKSMKAQQRQQKSEAAESRKKANHALDQAVEKKTKDRAERAIKDEIEQEADHILREGDPVNYLKEQFLKIHIGDGTIFSGLLASIGSQLCLNTEGIQPGLTGESGKGKTDSCRAFYHLLPEKYKLRGSFSDMSLFYHLKNPGTVLFFDDAAHLKEKLQDIIKQSTSAFQEPFIHRTIDKTGNAKELPLPQRLVYWITTVGGNFEMQFLNRQMNLSVDDSINQDELVTKSTLERYKAGTFRFNESKEVLISRAIIENLKDQPPVNVKIPFADRIEYQDKRNRRNHPMLLDTICAFAAIRQYQRERDPDGAILATPDDFVIAKTLWNGIGREQIGKLSKDDYRVISCIKEHGDKSYDSTFSIPRQTAMSILKFSSKKLHNIIHGIEGTGGLREKVVGFELVQGSKTVETRDGEKRIVRYDELQYSGSLDIFGQYQDVVWLTKNEN